MELPMPAAEQGQGPRVRDARGVPAEAAFPGDAVQAAEQAQALVDEYEADTGQEATIAYKTVLPANGGAPYTVRTNIGGMEVRSVDVDADAELLLTSTDFNPGALTNAGTVEVGSDELILAENVSNDGVIRFDTDTGAEEIRVQID
ncbi:MAG: hypothetical protein GY778_21125, partial [bacterium]|nr:hypothetical protein [bacterium]